MRRAASFAAVIVLGGLGALAVIALRHAREEAPLPPLPLRLAFSGAPGTDIGSGDEALDAAISPDEREIVFVATGGGAVRLWRRPLAAARAEPLHGSDGAQLPAWKQAGRVVSFFSGGRLRQISLVDGTVHDLADAPSPAGATWLSDGSLLFAGTGTGPIRRLANGAAGDATRMRSGERRHVYPVSTSDGNGFVYVAVRDDGRRIARLVTSTGDRELVQTSGHAQLVDDLLLYVRDGVLLTQRFDAESGTVTGRAVPLAVDVGVSPSGRALFTASPRLLVSAGASSRARQVVWFDATNGRRLAAVGDPGDLWQVRLSADDTQLAVSMIVPLLRTVDIFRLTAVSSGPPERVTTSLFADTDPVWSPDGGRLLFRSLDSGQPKLLVRRVQADDSPIEQLLRLESDVTPTDWTAGPGRGRVLYHTEATGTGMDIWMLDLGSGQRTQVTSDGFNQTDARWSPDARWLVYVSDESGTPDIYVQAWPDARRMRVSFGGGVRPRWSGDGRAILFLRGSQIMRSGRDTATGQFGSATPVVDIPGVRDFDVAHRSNRLAALTPVTAGAASEITTIVDWMSAARSPQ